jgi:hypothetical protein
MLLSKAWKSFREFFQALEKPRQASGKKTAATLA